MLAKERERGVSHLRMNDCEQHPANRRMEKKWLRTKAETNKSLFESAANQHSRDSSARLSARRGPISADLRIFAKFFQHSQVSIGETPKICGNFSDRQRQQRDVQSPGIAWTCCILRSAVRPGADCNSSGCDSPAPGVFGKIAAPPGPDGTRWRGQRKADQQWQPASSIAEMPIEQGGTGENS